MSEADEIEARANALPVMFFGSGDDSRCWVIDDAGNTLATNAAPDLARFVVNARDDVPNLCRALRERDETIANMTNAINSADVSAAHDRDTIAALRLGIDARVRTLTQERDDAAEIAMRLRDELRERDERIAALTAERDAAQTIIAGRTTPPTIKQARSHSHGTRGAFVVMLGDGGAHYSARVVTGLQRFEKTPQRWWAIDAEGRPCAWPIVEAK